MIPRVCIPRSIRSSHALILPRMVVLLIAAQACSSAAFDLAGSGVPDGTLPAVYGAPRSGLIPQGIARPCQRATMSPSLQGMLVQVLVNEGARVEKGEILAVMDNRVAQAAVNAARAAAERKAEIEHAKLALALARSLFARHSALQESQAGAEFELEQARVGRDQAEATLASAQEAQLQARRNLALEQARLESHNVRAPFDGQVVRVGATVGTSLTPADKFLTIVNLDSLEAELHLPLKLFDELQVGNTYQLTAFAPVNCPVPARLAFASPMIDPASKTFHCLFAIDNRAHQFPAGFGVRFDSPQSVSRHEDKP
jgi:RND family efflux transporter MFP subunit